MFSLRFTYKTQWKFMVYYQGTEVSSSREAILLFWCFIVDPGLWRINENQSMTGGCDNIWMDSQQLFNGFLTFPMYRL